MKNKAIIMLLTFLAAILALNLASAHDVYYDDHHHFNTISLDEYRYDYDNYYRSYYDNYPRRTYYSDYADDYYIRGHDKYYYTYPIVYSIPKVRSYGHGDQIVRVRAYPIGRYDDYYNDDYYNYHDDYEPRRYYTDYTYLGYDKQVKDGNAYYSQRY